MRTSAAPLYRSAMASGYRLETPGTSAAARFDATASDDAGVNLLLPAEPRWPVDRGQPIVEMTDVTLEFGRHPVLRGLDLRIAPGKITVLIGTTGSGKTVLLKLMTGLLRPQRGQVRVFGRDLATADRDQITSLRKRMAMMFQNYALFDDLSVEDNVSFVLRENSDLGAPASLQRARQLLATLGLDASRHLLPAALSGGMKRRVGLARALVANPELAVLDEPTTGLDPLMVATVDGMIAAACRQQRMTMVLVSHDLASVERLADRVAFLHDGRIIFEGTYPDLLASTLAPIRAFLSPAGTKSAAPRVLGPAATPHTPTPPQEPPAVEIIDVHKRFGDHQVLRGVNLVIPRHQTTVLIGGSGSGKSVLIKHIMGLLAPTSGQVRVFGRAVADLDQPALAALRQKIGFVFQHAALLDWLSVADNIAFPLREHRQLSRTEIRARVEEAIAWFDLGELRARMPGDLSAGQRKRVALARAVVTRPELMIYDEPTTGQDPIRRHEVEDMITDAQAAFHLTSIVISHDMESSFRIADRIALLHEGTIAAQGTPAEVRASVDPYVQAFLHASTAAKSPLVAPRRAG